MSKEFQKKRPFKKYLYYFLMYLVFAFGGIPFFYVPKWTKLTFAILSILFFLGSRKKIDRSFIAVLSFITYIFIFQYIKFQGGTLINLGYILMTFSTPYFVLKIIGKDFSRIYVNIVYISSIISIIFYIASSVSPSFYSFTSTIPFLIPTDPTPIPNEPGVNPLLYNQSFIIYTFELAKFGNLLRCPGPFWEPGVFAIYLLVALIFNSILENNFFNKKNLVLMFTLIITFSTAGYIGLFIFLTFSIIKTYGKRFLSVFVIPLLIWSFIYMYKNLSFLEEKVVTQIETDYDGFTKIRYESRMSSLRKAFISLSNNPLFGRGLVKTTAAARGSIEDVAYGFAMYTRLGIIGSILIIVFWFKGLKMINHEKSFHRSFAFVSLLMLLIPLTSQSVYFAPILLMLFYYPLIFWQRRDLHLGVMPSKVTAGK